MYHWYIKTFRKYINVKNEDIRKKLRKETTKEEKILWGYLRVSGLGFKFRRQQSIGNYVVDFCCPKRKLIIELDGSQHLDNQEYDENRTSFLESLDYKVLRFWNNDIHKNIDGVVMRIKEYL